MNAQRNSQQSRPRLKRFFRRHIIVLSIVSLITLLLIALIVWILLTQSVTQGSPLIALVASIVTILLGPTSLYIWIIESSKKSAEHQQAPAISFLLPSESQTSSSSAPASPPALGIPQAASNKFVQIQTLAQTPTDIAVATVNQSHANAVSEGNDAVAQSDEMPFQVGPPLPKDAATYIERQADQDALRHLRRMEYIALIDPRQQGKTSLIIHLMQKLAMQNYSFVIFDLSEQKYQNKAEEEWYKALGASLLRNLRFLPPDAQPVLPTDSSSWEFFLSDIAEASRQAKQKTVIILDEVREIPSSYATPFFTVIRMIFNQRAINSHYEYLTFIISGAFNPNELIRDEQVSKFIAQRIHLDDFDITEVKQLMTHLRLIDELADLVARRIYDWTDGQPYLTQRVCHLLSSQIMPHTHQGISELVERLGRQLYDDQNYLRRITRLREREPKLFEYAQGIAYGNRPYFSSGLLDQHFRLAHIYGVIKADEEGRCRIRNRICEHALTRIITQPLQ